MAHPHLGVGVKGVTGCRAPPACTWPCSGAPEEALLAPKSSGRWEAVLLQQLLTQAWARQRQGGARQGPLGHKVGRDGGWTTGTGWPRLEPFPSQAVLLACVLSSCPFPRRLFCRNLASRWQQTAAHKPHSPARVSQRGGILPSACLPASGISLATSKALPHPDPLAWQPATAPPHLLLLPTSLAPPPFPRNAWSSREMPPAGDLWPEGGWQPLSSWAAIDWS